MGIFVGGIWEGGKRTAEERREGDVGRSVRLQAVREEAAAGTDTDRIQ
ncbi:hypothetical protein CLOHYLEM_06818 [[Clostridium] hylemonae DSM 15053]|uniref:Uncharacterized protein n=1 Tax=[Clostridium] hylemonae DSM 15053 TaxID=553973 RepID=C0C405_9FIRM|nr:hypothetical protein CLOHYLEM_06818 [[Clostridium] hylemonae DSM 15053]